MVLPLGLEEDHRVVVGDRLLDHPVAVVRVGAGYDLQTRGVRELGFWRLAVVLDGADATTERDPDHDRHRVDPVTTGVQLRHLRNDLVVGGIDEPVELDLDHGPVAPHRHPDRGAHDPRLGQRAVHHPICPEVLLQAVGDPEDPAEDTDVLPHQHDLGVVLHGAPQPGVERLRQRHRLRRGRLLPGTGLS